MWCRKIQGIDAEALQAQQRKGVNGWIEEGCDLLENACIVNHEVSHMSIIMMLFCAWWMSVTYLFIGEEEEEVVNEESMLKYAMMSRCLYMLLCYVYIHMEIKISTIWNSCMPLTHILDSMYSSCVKSIQPCHIQSYFSFVCIWKWDREDIPGADCIKCAMVLSHLSRIVKLTDRLRDSSRLMAMGEEHSWGDWGKGMRDEGWGFKN